MADGSSLALLRTPKLELFRTARLQRLGIWPNIYKFENILTMIVANKTPSHIKTVLAIVTTG